MLDHLKGYVDTDIRICFAIAWFDSEESAQEATKDKQVENSTYNGGMFHGMRCGREERFDYIKEGRKLYAVTY